MSKQPNINWEAAPPAGCVFIDICDGVAGPSVSIGNLDGAIRVAGPKAWGGGRTSQRFTAKLDDLKAAIEAYEQ